MKSSDLESGTWTCSAYYVIQDSGAYFLSRCIWFVCSSMFKEKSSLIMAKRTKNIVYTYLPAGSEMIHEIL